MAKNPNDIVPVLYGSVVQFKNCPAWCKYHHIHLTKNQILRKNCLGKQCKCLDKIPHPFWEEREKKETRKKNEKRRILMFVKMDLTGQRFGRLVVISEEKPHIYKSGRKDYMWLCKCDCGNTIIVNTNRLRMKQTQSCGCYNKERVLETKYIDLKNQTFGRLTVLNYLHKNNALYWRCKCSCGNYTEVLTSHLIRGKILSCGCLKREKTGQINRSHGLSNSRIYNIWCGIKFRCYNKKCNEFHRYGGRGIKMCDNWKNSFEDFCDWAKNNGYNDTLTIERNNLDGNYCPENCCWIPLKKQARNTSRTKYLEYKGESKPMVEWAEIFGVKYSLLADRIQRGWSIEKALLTPVKENRNARLY